MAVVETEAARAVLDEALGEVRLLKAAPLRVNFAAVGFQNSHSNRNRRPIDHSKQVDQARNAPRVGVHFPNYVREIIKKFEAIFHAPSVPRRTDANHCPFGQEDIFV